MASVTKRTRNNVRRVNPDGIKRVTLREGRRLEIVREMEQNFAKRAKAAK